jgi:hypothetical protein
MESSECLKLHRDDLREVQNKLRNQDETAYTKERALLEYVYSDPYDLHITQTLDRSHYLQLKSTEDRDYDQVIHRHTDVVKDHIDDQPVLRPRQRKGQRYLNPTVPSLLMVNRLWMWKIDTRMYSIHSCAYR